MLTVRRPKTSTLDALHRISFLAACSRSELALVDRLGVAIDVAPGRVLTMEGTAARECFVTLDGIAVARRAGRPIGTIPAGSIAGEMALLDHTTRNATVVADTSMRLLVLDGREFAALLGVAPSVAAGIERIRSERKTAAATVPSRP
jgi:CRP/FNR family cyclic AMP-dependent transcriptional regulator